MTSLLTGEVLQNLQQDTLRYGTALLGTRLGTNIKPMQAINPFHPSEVLMNDSEWFKSSVLTLLGFAVYQIIVRKLVPTDGTKGSVKMALDDILKFGTMYIAYRIISKKSLFALNDGDWIKETTFIIAGLMTYDFLVRYVYNTNQLAPRTKAAVDDTLKYGTMFIVARWLSDRSFDGDWAIACGSFVVGMIIYDFLL